MEDLVNRLLEERREVNRLWRDEVERATAALNEMSVLLIEQDNMLRQRYDALEARHTHEIAALVEQHVQEVATIRMEHHQELENLRQEHARYHQNLNFNPVVLLNGHVDIQEQD